MFDNILSSLAIFSFALMITAGHDETEREVLVVQSPSSPLQVSFEQIEVEATEKIESTLSFKYNGESISTGSQVVEQTSEIVPAILIGVTTDYKFVNVTVFKSKSETVSTTKISDKRYLLLAPAGTYGVHIDVYDPEKGLDKVVQEIVVEASVGDFSDLALMSADLARGMEDSPTQKTISEDLSSVIPTLESLEYVDALAGIKTSITLSLTKRRGASLDKDWYDGWRVPLDKEFEALQLQTTEDLLQAWGEIAKAMYVEAVTVLESKPKKYILGDIVNDHQLQKVCENGICSLKWVRIK